MANQMVYHGMFVQDDWRVNDRLTLNIGLRYEVELPTYERDNRNVWPRRDEPEPIEAAATAAYAANRFRSFPQSVPGEGRAAVSSRTPRASHQPGWSRGYWKADLNNILPRLGFAFKIDEKTSFPRRWASYDAIGLLRIYPRVQHRDAMVPTVDRGLTFQADLNNPFPTGVQTPTGSSAG